MARGWLYTLSPRSLCCVWDRRQVVGFLWPLIARPSSRFDVAMSGYKQSLLLQIALFYQSGSIPAEIFFLLSALLCLVLSCLASLRSLLRSWFQSSLVVFVSSASLRGPIGRSVRLECSRSGSTQRHTARHPRISG